MKTCNGKNCYSKNEAEKVRRAVLKQRSPRIRIYECETCHHWHLTSVTNQL